MTKPSIGPIQSQNAYLQSIAESCGGKEFVQENITNNFSYFINKATWINHTERPDLEEIKAAFADGDDKKDRIYELLLRLDPASLGNVAGSLGSLDEKEGKNPGSKSSVPKGLKIINGVLDPNTTKEVLGNFVKERSFKGAFLISDSEKTYDLGSSPDDSERPRDIQSIGKVLTGVLISKMISKGLIPKEKLNSPIEIDEQVKEHLSDEMKGRLSKTTLYQAMTHRAGFGNYIRHEGESQAESYMGKARSGNLGNEQPTKPEDFLRFADKKMCDFEPGDDQKYSDVGIIFAALSAQHHYNKKYTDESRKEYQTILEELVLTPAGITSFSVSPPENAIYDPKDPAAAKICGSPAGGYWMTPRDLGKFGQWFCKEWKNESFRDTVNEYGEEFFNKERQTLGHSGILPGDHSKGISGSSTWLSADPNTGVVVAMASNDPFAWVLGENGISKMKIERFTTKVSPTPGGAIAAVREGVTGDDGPPSQPKSILKPVEGESVNAKVNDGRK